MTPCSLEQALSVEEPHVVTRFLHHFDVTEEQAQDLFVEVKRWLWLVATFESERVADDRASGSPGLYVTPALAMLDEMWHTFILCTRQYMAFCDACFGTYIHHESPVVSEESPAEAESRLRWQMEYVYDRLGRETLLKWYSEYPEQYPVDRIAQLRLR